MKTPTWDAKFHEHSIHGLEAQRFLIKQSARSCSQKRVAIDVGAHIGLCSIAMSEIFTHVRAFEPVLENYICLMANVSKNVITFKTALGDQDGKTYSMELPEKGNSGCWHIVGGSKQMTTLDALGYLVVDFIKLDVEGYEGAVLQGGVKTLERCKPVVLFEDNGLGPTLFEDAWIDPKEILTGLGYKFERRIHKNEVWTC